MSRRLHAQVAQEPGARHVQLDPEQGQVEGGVEPFGAAFDVGGELALARGLRRGGSEGLLQRGQQAGEPVEGEGLRRGGEIEHGLGEAPHRPLHLEVELAEPQPEPSHGRVILGQITIEAHAQGDAGRLCQQAGQPDLERTAVEPRLHGLPGGVATGLDVEEGGTRDARAFGEAGAQRGKVGEQEPGGERARTDGEGFEPGLRGEVEQRAGRDESDLADLEIELLDAHAGRGGVEGHLRSETEVERLAGAQLQLVQRQAPVDGDRLAGAGCGQFPIRGQGGLFDLDRERGAEVGRQAPEIDSLRVDAQQVDARHARHLEIRRQRSDDGLDAQVRVLAEDRRGRVEVNRIAQADVGQAHVELANVALGGLAGRRGEVNEPDLAVAQADLADRDPLQHGLDLGRERLVRLRLLGGAGLPVEDVLIGETSVLVTEDVDPQPLDVRGLDPDLLAEREDRLPDGDVESHRTDLHQGAVVLRAGGIRSDGERLDASAQAGEQGGGDLADLDLPPELLLDLGLVLGDQLGDHLVQIDQVVGEPGASDEQDGQHAEGNGKDLEESSHGMAPDARLWQQASLAARRRSANHQFRRATGSH